MNTTSALTPVQMKDPDARCNLFVGDHERCGEPGVVAFALEGNRGVDEVRCAEHDPRKAANR